MKKTKALFILFLVLVISVMSLSVVSAHSVELDPNSLIGFPIMIMNGKGSITISSSETGYSLYYQAVEIANNIYEQMETTQNTGKEELNSIKSEKDALYAECNNLETIYDAACEAYEEKLESGADDEELETLKTAYETAKTNYQNKITEYNDKVEEFNNKANEINETIKELIPTYVENHWVKTNDESFSVDLSQFSGKKAFAIWAKLVSSDGTVSYDEATYTMSGTKVDDVEVESVRLDKTTLSLTEGNSYILTATITPSNATNKLLDWSSDNKNVAKVENGRVTAIAEGTANITVTTRDGNHTATCKVIVTKTATDDGKKDETIAGGKLPQTGSSAFIIIGAIILVSVLGIVTYKKVKYMNF